MILREYGISDNLLRRVGRKFIPFLSQRILPFKLDQSIVSISFDDFPKSVMENALPLLDKYGWKASFYVAAGLINTTNHLGLHFNQQDLKRLQCEEHEIGCHTYNHLNITEIPEVRLMDELRANAKAARALGITTPLRTFAYPFGETSIARKSVLSHEFASMRGIMRGVHYNKVDLNQIKSVPIYSGPDLSQTHNFIKGLKRKAGWLTLFTHDVRENPSEWGCTPQDFTDTLALIHESGARVIPIQRTIDFLSGAHGGNIQPNSGGRE